MNDFDRFLREPWDFVTVQICSQGTERAPVIYLALIHWGDDGISLVSS